MSVAYEPQGLFRDVFTQTEVEAMLVEAKKTFTVDGGEQISSWSTSGNQSVTKFNLDAADMIAECLYALQALDPVTYPTEPNRTVVTFSGT
tara:strand:+ start:493 stop:765 length:273 start_codon:yes stop_codon:yes gene_type:complete